VILIFLGSTCFYGYHISTFDKELLIANSIQVDALAQLIIKKGFITNEEFLKMLKEVQTEYKSKRND